MELEQKFENEYVIGARKLEDQVNQLFVRVNALQRLFSSLDQDQAASQKIHQTSLAMLDFERLIERNDSIAKPLSLSTVWSRLTRVAQTSEDDFMKTALSSVPANVIESGVSSLKQLQQRFDVVEKATRQAAYVPPGSGMGGQLLGALFSALTVQERALIHGDDDHTHITRAGFFIQNGALLECMNELNALSALPRATADDFIRVLRDRLIVDQARDALQAHISLLCLSL